MIEPDKTRIYEVVSNLLRNAIKFTDSGTIFITSTVEDRNAIISIKDTGRSIDPELMPRLYTKFASVGNKDWAWTLSIKEDLFKLIVARYGRRTIKMEKVQHLHLLCRF
jgi:two-component system, OmpR family, sensor histidine kinase VicK